MTRDITAITEDGSLERVLKQAGFRLEEVDTNARNQRLRDVRGDDFELTHVDVVDDNNEAFARVQSELREAEI